MAVTPQNYTFNVGRDVAVVVIAPDGTQLDLIGQIEINWRGLYETVTHEPINSPPLRRFLPMGHEFTLTLERRGPDNEALFSQIEQGYWAGGYPNGTQNAGTIYIYVDEADGGTTTYQGNQVSLMMSERMRARQRTAVGQTIEGFASTWQMIAAG